jgi:hypothetical protein
LRVLQEHEQRGTPVPAAIRRLADARVELRPHLIVEWDAFFVLNQQRTSSGFGGIDPLSMQSIEAYCRLYGYEPGSEEVEDLVRSITTLDLEYRIYQRERTEEREKFEQQQQEEAERKKHPQRPPSQR